MSEAPARVFVGLELPAELATPLADSAARALPARDFRLARADGLHLTLVFLGAVPPARLPVLAAALQDATADLPAPELELAGPGAFPDAEAARVLWVGVSERTPGRLAAARAAVLAACGRAGVEPEPGKRERFHPHVTLARPRRPGRPAPPAFLALAPAGRFTAREAVLFESQKDAGPNRYLALARAGFRGIS